jgi:hypothetical protein
MCIKKEEKKTFFGKKLFFNNKGMSEIVTTLLIVLLSLVAIGVVWFIVNNLLKSGTEGISSSAKCLNINIEIKQLRCADGEVNQTCNVTISRSGTENSDIGGVKMFFVDKDTETSGLLIDVAGNIQPLVGKKISNQDTGIPNGNAVDLVQVTPYFLDDSGKQQLCSQTTSLEI